MTWTSRERFWMPSFKKDFHSKQPKWHSSLILEPRKAHPISLEQSLAHVTSSVMEPFVDPKLDKSVTESLSKLDKAFILCEFLECFVHQVLFARRLYDDRLFETKRLYDMFVKKSLHPNLNDYIHSTIYTLKV